jgi:hypothetical protein
VRIRAQAAVAAFLFCFFLAQIISMRITWLPNTNVTQFPPWAPLNLDMVREMIARVRPRASQNGYAVFLGDSVAHGDGYGKPSETAAALVDREIPSANLTSPSLGFSMEEDLLRYVIEQTDARHVIVEINPKWVVQDWTPEKFENLRYEINATHLTPDHQLSKDHLRNDARRLKRFLLLEELRDKVRFRLTNFTLYHFMSEGFHADGQNLWWEVTHHEQQPNYQVPDLSQVSADVYARYLPYHQMTWETVDHCSELNKLLALMSAAPERTVAWLVWMNPKWGETFGTLKKENEIRMALAAKIRGLGVPVLCVQLDAKDYQDDMHLTVSGAQKMAALLAQELKKAVP